MQHNTQSRNLKYCNSTMLRNSTNYLYLDGRSKINKCFDIECRRFDFMKVLRELLTFLRYWSIYFHQTVVLFVKVIVPFY